MTDKHDFGSEYILMSPEGWAEHVKDLWHGQKGSEGDKGMSGFIADAVDEGRVAKIEAKVASEAIVIELIVKPKIIKDIKLNEVSLTEKGLEMGFDVVKEKERA